MHKFIRYKILVKNEEFCFHVGSISETFYPSRRLERGVITEIVVLWECKSASSSGGSRMNQWSAFTDRYWVSQ